MNKDNLLKKRSALEDAFNRHVQAQRGIEVEQYRLQGEYRLVNQLIEDVEKRENEVKPAKEKK